jgi:hypothetical protein
MKIALLPGGFKPPHLGHYNMAKYLADFADKVIIRIGQKERDGIGKELALEIFNFYKEFDPDPRAKKLIISIAQSPSPIRDVYDFVETIAPEGSEVILGLGEKDAGDGRYDSIPKFAEPRNIKSSIELVPPQAGGISGTQMRGIIKANNKEEFFKFIPGYLPEEIKEEIWTKLLDTTMPQEVEEMMGGTMNKQEMDKHNANMKKLSKHLSKVNSQGDMVPVPTNLTKGLKRKLYEKVGIQRGTVESEVQFLSRELFELFKENLGKKYHTGGFEGWLEGPDSIAEFEITDLTFTPRDAHEMGGAPYSIEAEADDEEMEIAIDYNPVLFPEEYNNLIAELKETLRHEIEHIVQFNFMPGAEELMKKWNDGGSWVEYLTRPYEIPAFVRGLYKRAKTKKIKLIDAIDEFIEEYIDRFEGPEEIEQVRKSWTQWAKENLPNSQLNEGPIGDFTSKIKTAAIEQAKDFKSFVPLLKKWAIKSITPEEKSKLETISKDILKSTAIGVTWPILGLTGHALIGAAIKKLSKGKYAGFLPSKLASVVEYKEEINEMKLFSKDWWLNIITEEILDEQGGDTSWTDDEGNKITLQDILDMTKNVPQKDYPTEKLAKIVLNWDDNPEEVERIDQVEISKQYPILIMVDEGGKIQWILDGNHRAQKALRSKSKTIPAKLIKPSNLDAKAKKVLLGVVQESLNEGGAAGHMAHPFDLPNVNTGRDLIKSFEQASNSLKNEPGSVKIDGVNSSIRLVNFDGKREFAMDRGSKKALDLRGVTKADLEDRFGPGHGMIKAGGNVLDIFNDGLSSTQSELEALGLWGNPNIMFNMEYVSGKSNVQDYGKNFLAIHGLLEVETKEVIGKSGKTLQKRIPTEKSFSQDVMDRYLKKLEPFAAKKGFEIYGSVPTIFTKEPDFKSALSTQYTIDFAEGDKTKSLSQWLNDVNNIPKTDRLKMNVNGSIKDVGALSKQVYFAVFGGENVDDLFDNEQDIQKAIQGATTYLATEKLGDAILDVLDSPMGSVNDHEGVVIRDPNGSDKPYKITGKFITGGVSSQFQTK